MRQANSAEILKSFLAVLFSMKVSGSYIVDMIPVLVYSNMLIQGKFYYDDSIPARNLEDIVPSAVKEERHSFLSFINVIFIQFISY